MAVIHAKQLADGRWECQGCLCKFTKHKRDKDHPNGWTVPPKFHDDACKKSFHHGGLSLKKIMGMLVQVADQRIIANVKAGSLKADARLKAEEARA
jgi:hypothetical protein